MSDNNESRETLADIVAEMRDHAECAKAWVAAIKPGVVMNLADRIEAAARRAYNEIDSAVCGIEDAASSEIGAVRKVMDNTIGDYYE